MTGEGPGASAGANTSCRLMAAMLDNKVTGQEKRFEPREIWFSLPAPNPSITRKQS